MRKTLETGNKKWDTMQKNHFSLYLVGISWPLPTYNNEREPKWYLVTRESHGELTLIADSLHSANP